MRSAVLAAIFCFAPFVVADDFKTNSGKEYKNATVSRVEPDGIVLITSDGVAKVYFSELPKEVQDRFGYDAAKAAAYVSEQTAAYHRDAAAAQAEQENAKRSQEATAAKLRIEASAQQRHDASMASLRARVEELQQQENGLLGEITRAKHAETRAKGMRKRNPTFTDPLEVQLPALKARLDDVRTDLKKAKSDLQKAEAAENDDDTAEKPRRRK